VWALVLRLLLAIATGTVFPLVVTAGYWT